MLTCLSSLAGLESSFLSSNPELERWATVKKGRFPKPPLLVGGLEIAAPCLYGDAVDGGQGRLTQLRGWTITAPLGLVSPAHIGVPAFDKSGREISRSCRYPFGHDGGGKESDGLYLASIRLEFALMLPAIEPDEFLTCSL